MILAALHEREVPSNTPNEEPGRNAPTLLSVDLLDGGSQMAQQTAIYDQEFQFIVSAPLSYPNKRNNLLL